MTLTRQEAFNTALAGLRQQGRPSGGSGGCFYRSPDGCKCAIGWLIPDDKYSPDLEGCSAESADVIAAMGGDSQESHFYYDMQGSIHDHLTVKDGNFRDNLELRAKDFAYRWRLVYPMPANAPC